MNQTTESTILERVTLAEGWMDGDYNVLLIRAGTANGLRFSEELLAYAAGQFQGAPVFVDHQPRGQPFRSVRDLVGQVSHAHYDETLAAIRGRLSLARQSRWLQELIATFGEQPHILGLSADLWLRRDREGRVLAIETVNSVDIVVHPAAGGRFLPAGEADTASRERQEQATATAIEPHIRNGGIPMSEQSSVERIQTASQTPPDPQPLSPDPRPPTPGLSLELRAALAEWSIERAKLPPALKDGLRAAFQTLPGITLEALQQMVQAQQEAWAQAMAASSIKNLGEGPLRLRDSRDRLEMAFARLMGVADSDAERDVPRLSGIRELYDTLTGDWERHGVFYAERVTLANVTTSTMAEVVRNVLNKVLLRAYESRPQWWRPIVYEEDFPTMQTVRWVTLGGISELDTVSEGAAYTEKTWDDYAETADWVKKGNYIGLTMEMIDRDDVAAVRALPRKLGLAANRTLASAVAALFTNNAGTGPVLADGNNLFDATNHGNLLTAALSADAWDAVIQAMYKQTEYHSGKRLGVRPRYCLVPIELEKTALGIFTSEYEYGGGNFDTNVRRAQGGNVITVPDWSDANDWAAAADPADLEGVCIAYRYGRAPELFLAADELMGSMFTNDEMRIKVRFVYALGIGDYRALHKNNVS